MKKYRRWKTRSDSKYLRKYGQSLSRLAKELGVCEATISNWDKQGFDIYFKADCFKGSLKRKKILNQLWTNLKQRCGNPNDPKYKYYGGKGITIKLEKSDLFILWERDKAEEMKQPSIDRLDSTKDYEFSNCRFIEMVENRKRRYYGSSTQS